MGYGEWPIYYATIRVRGFYHLNCEDHEEDKKKEKKPLSEQEIVGLYGIDKVMETLRRTQLSHIERMKQQTKENGKK